MVVPLIVRDRPIGALNAYRLGEVTAFSDEEFDLIRRFADLVALALDNTRIRHQLEQEAQTDWLTGPRQPPPLPRAAARRRWIAPSATAARCR